MAKPKYYRNFRRNSKTFLPDLPQGVRLISTLQVGRKGPVICVAFSPDGKLLVSCGMDGTIQLWDPESGSLIRTLKGNRIPLFSVAFSPDGRMLASGGKDKTIQLWDPESGSLIRTLEGHTNYVHSVAFSPDSRMLASGGGDNTIQLWDPESGSLIRTLEGHTDYVLNVVFSPDGRMLASGGGDNTIQLWDPESGSLIRTLEGHTGSVFKLAFSPDIDLLVSKSSDDTIRIWNCITWESVVSIPFSNDEHDIICYSLAIHPNLPILAAGFLNPRLDGLHTISIILWEFDLDLVLPHKRSQRAISYKNAKVVLVGDTGVGKSGLAKYMVTRKFVLTESTHGRHVWKLKSQKVVLGDGRKQTREVLLWDLAGQPGYRLVHQLNIDEAVIALVVIDARSETDPLGSAEFWSKAIDQAKSNIPIVKILVEARVDRGGIAVSPDNLQSFCDKYRFAYWFRTSAMTGEGVDNLIEAIEKLIPWDRMPEVISTTLFTKIRDFLQKEKERGDQVIIEQLDRFQERYIKKTGHIVTSVEFRAVVDRLAASGLAQLFKCNVFKDGKKSDYVLMQPEYLDAYASTIINLARKDPRGIGHVSEARIHRGDIGLGKDERIQDSWAEELVITEAIEQLIQHDIALRERLSEDHKEAGDYLILPSQYTRTSPYPGKIMPGVSYIFEGACRAIFTTLVVRLTHHQHFIERDFWKDAACYATKEGSEFIVVLTELSPSKGRLSLYFENNLSREEQNAFIRYVKIHVINRALPESVVIYLEYCCPACGYPWDEAVVKNRLHLGKHDIICPNCEFRSPLLNLILDESAAEMKQAKADAWLMDADAEVARKRQLAVLAIHGKEQVKEYDVFLSYNSEDRNEVLRVAEMLKGVGIRSWLDVWDLIPGQRWQSQLDSEIGSVKSAAVFVGPSGIGPWQELEMEGFIREFITRKSPVIPVILPGLDKAPELPRLLNGFMWVDLRDLSDENPDPLAYLVAGILGMRPRDMMPYMLIDQVKAILKSPSRPSRISSELPPVVLPVKRMELSRDDLDAIVQQVVQILGISSRSILGVKTESGSVRIVLHLDDMIAVSQLFSMAQKGDPNLIRFFDQCQINIDEFQTLNAAAKPIIEKLYDEERRQQPDEIDYKVGKVIQPDGLSQWAGNATVATLAIVFTDIVDSTKLCYDLGDSTWDSYRQLHFAKIQQFITNSSGYFIKNTGDGVLAVFHNADNAVTFACETLKNTGHAVIRIRAGIHIGQVAIDGNDTFGRHVNLTARVMNVLKHDGLMITDAVKSDLADRGSETHREMHWKQHRDIELKGVPDPQTLWELEDLC